MDKCLLCYRELGTNWDEHHLIPKVKGGHKKEKVKLHKICHRTIHATFKEAELANYYNTIDKLLSHDKIKSFVKWVQKKPSDYFTGCKETNGRRK